MVLNREGTDVPRKNVTPAECQLLRSMYENICGCNPITLLEVVKGENDEPAQAAVIVERDQEEPANLKKARMRKRTSSDEIRRLRGKYTGATIEKFFPGLNPQLPETFEDAGFEEGQGWQTPEKNAGSKSSINRLRGPADDDAFVFMDVPEGFDTSKLQTQEA